MESGEDTAQLRTAGERYTSRKFWALVATLVASAWACRWLLGQLIDLVDRAKISEAVFENLSGMVITTEAMFAATIVAWWMGANVLQKIAFMRGGGGQS